MPFYRIDMMNEVVTGKNKVIINQKLELSKAKKEIDELKLQIKMLQHEKNILQSQVERKLPELYPIQYFDHVRYPVNTSLSSLY